MRERGEGETGGDKRQEMQDFRMERRDRGPFLGLSASFTACREAIDLRLS
jgi:hypothetical protein